MSNEKTDGGLNSRSVLLQSTSVISMGTLASRVLGFVRDVVLARFLGTGVQADALFVAFRIPNLLRDFVGEGAVNSSVVPVLAEYRQHEEPERFWSLVSRLLLVASLVLGALTVLGMVFAPGIIRIMAPGFAGRPDQFALTVSLTRMLFPYAIFIGLTAYTMGILYTFRRFTVPAFSPCLLNLSMIVSAVWAFQAMREPVYGVAAGILVGGIAQMMVQMPPLFRLGFACQRPLPTGHPAIVQMGRLLVPRMIGAGVYQLGVVVDTVCASLASVVGAGGISAIYYANRIIQLPMGLFGVALASAALPTLSALSAERNHRAMGETILFSLENIFFVMLPISTMTMVLAEPVIRLLFERGAFDTYSTAITTQAVVFYMIGLAAFGGVKVLVSAFHAQQDTRTPVVIAAVCVVSNLILNLILMWPMRIAGIALASSIVSWGNFVALSVIMARRLPGVTEGLGVFFLRAMAASVAASAVVAVVWRGLGAWAAWPGLIAAGLCGAVVYLIVCRIVRVPQARDLGRWVRGRFSRGA